jgi:hypothetical protein
MKDFTVETMTLLELEGVVNWAASEGWNPGLYDAAVFHDTDPDGFFLGRLNGKPVAAVSGVSYGQEFGFLGLYIVDPAHRDKGYGGRVSLAAREHLKGCKCIGLDGVKEQQQNYARHGFHYAYPSFRYEGRGSGDPVPTPAGSKILSLAEFPFEEIVSYDQRHFPARRSTFLKTWISQPDSLALGCGIQGKLSGFAVRRKCLTGHKIGPLFANSPVIAAQLLAGIREELAAEEPFYIDIPGNNPAAKHLVDQEGMTVVFETARMYQGPEPELPIDEIYGISTFELG